MQMLTDIAIDPAGDVWVSGQLAVAERRFGKPPAGAIAPIAQAATGFAELPKREPA